MQVERGTIRAAIREAFWNVLIPTRIEEMTLPRFTGDDAFEMARELVGRHWSEIPIERLFVHRESLVALGPVAFRAYLPAYLAAVLVANDWQDRYHADLSGYLMWSLKCFDDDPQRAAETRERLSLLDAKQRDVVADVLRFLITRWRDKDASEVLRDW